MTDVAHPVAGHGSLFSMALGGSVVSLTVLLVLMVMSMTSWAYLVVTLRRLRRVREAGRIFEKRFWDTRSLAELHGSLETAHACPQEAMFAQGYEELAKGIKMRDAAIPRELSLRGTLDNISRSLRSARSLERAALARSLPFMATCASVCPFVGLFGTVVGLMSALSAIGLSGASDLASVAPGISEALLATAFGLGAAIPALLGYNVCSQQIAAIMRLADKFSSDFLNIVERHLVVETKESGDLNKKTTQS